MIWRVADIYRYLQQLNLKEAFRSIGVFYLLVHVWSVRWHQFWFVSRRRQHGTPRLLKILCGFQTLKPLYYDADEQYDSVSEITTNKHLDRLFCVESVFPWPTDRPTDRRKKTILTCIGKSDSEGFLHWIASEYRHFKIKIRIDSKFQVLPNTHSSLPHELLVSMTLFSHQWFFPRSIEILVVHSLIQPLCSPC